MEPPLIEFKDVTKRFDSRTVLKKVNLQIYEGQVTTIIGLSGAGKSVLLKHIIGLIKPDEGVILFRGKPINEMKREERAAQLARISYMFQGNALFDSMTVYDNIALPLREKTRLKKGEIDSRVRARIKQTELADSVRKYPSELSGGMQKRVALARALVTDPSIVLFDEPTTGQDPVRKNAILSMIAEYQRRFGFTAILVSHEIPNVFFISNRILALYDRTIVFQGTPEELENFEHPFKDEVIHSLEGFEEELTGLHSRRQFKLLYGNQFKRQARGEYCVAVFTLERLDDIAAGMGYEAAQEVIRSMGAYIGKHLAPVGGFSTRNRMNEFLALFPSCNRSEAEAMIQEFVRDFQSQGVQEIRDRLRQQAAPGVCVEFNLLGGLAEGQPQTDIESIVESARSDRKEIGRFTCEKGEK